MEPRHDWGFFFWATVGFLLCFGFVAGFSIGLPFLWLGLALFVYGVLKGPAWPANLGLPAGMGAGCLLVAVFIAMDREPFPATWTTVGLCLIAAPTALFWWLRCRPGVRRRVSRA